jgi:hypothetical protein
VVAPSVVESELQQQAQRETTQESFEIEPATSKVAAAIVPAEIVLTAQKEHFNIVSTEKFVPEGVNGLNLEELIRTVTEVPIVEEAAPALRERTVDQELVHHVSPKDEVFITAAEATKPLDEVETLHEVVGMRAEIILHHTGPTINQLLTYL